MGAVNVLANTALHADADWTRILSSAAYSIRDSCRTFEHGGLVYLSNGYQPGGVIIHDLWRSQDAINWHLVNDDTPYLGWCPVVSFMGEIVALGDKIMRSTDGGETFTVALEDPPFVMPATTPETWQAVVRGTTLFLLGGNTSWWTTDLVTWNSRSMPFYRENFAAWDLNGTIYIAAGSNKTPADPAEVGYPGRTSFNDVWAVDDPASGTWTRVLEAAPWAKRMWPGFAVHGDELVITGGYNNVTGASNFNDTWVSRDGVVWREVVGSVYPKRHYPSVVSRNGRLILNNGNEAPNASPGVRNDVWQLL